MRRLDEIRDPTELPPPPTGVSEEEIAGALALMDTMTIDALEGPEFTDRYTEAIAETIEAEREEKPLPVVEEPEQPAQVLDLMAALQESVSKAEASRGDAGPADVHELPQPNWSFQNEVRSRLKQMMLQASWSSPRWRSARIS
jgi:DNA end-binding protein Ku